MHYIRCRQHVRGIQCNRRVPYHSELCTVCAKRRRLKMPPVIEYPPEPESFRGVWIAIAIALVLALIAANIGS